MIKNKYTCRRPGTSGQQKRKTMRDATNKQNLGRGRGSEYCRSFLQFLHCNKKLKVHLVVVYRRLRHGSFEPGEAHMETSASASRVQKRRRPRSAASEGRLSRSWGVNRLKNSTKCKIFERSTCIGLATGPRAPRHLGPSVGSDISLTGPCSARRARCERREPFTTSS